MYDSLLKHGILHQIVSRYSDVYLFTFITIKSDMNTSEKIVKILINENIFLLRVISLRLNM